MSARSIHQRTVRGASLSLWLLWSVSFVLFSCSARHTTENGSGATHGADFSAPMDSGAEAGWALDFGEISDLGDATAVDSDRTTSPDCETPVIRWRFGRWDYDKPEPRNENWEPLTKEEFEWLRNDFPDGHRRMVWRHPPHLTRYPDSPISPVWADEGESFQTSLLLANIMDSLDEHRAYLTVLVNYEPVDVRWTHWADERGGASIETTAGGLAVDIDNWGELIDLEIPADTFEEPGAFDVSIAVIMGRPGRKYFQIVKRVHVFHGGYEWFEPPCFAATTPSPPNADELPTIDNINVTALKEGLARVAGRTTVAEVTSVVRAAPGETVEIDISMFNKWGEEAPLPVAAIPTLEGVPIDEPLFYFVEESSPDRKVAIRRRIGVTLPEAAGVYDFNIPVWYGASLPAETPTREKLRLTIIGGASNMIRFEVQEP